MMSRTELEMQRRWFGRQIETKEADQSHLKSGGGDGTSGDMEARVAKLEVHIEHIRTELNKMSGVPTDIATLKERVSHLPSKGFVVTAAVSTIAGVVALIGLLQKLGLLT